MPEEFTATSAAGDSAGAGSSTATGGPSAPGNAYADAGLDPGFASFLESGSNHLPGAEAEEGPELPDALSAEELDQMELESQLSGDPRKDAFLKRLTSQGDQLKEAKAELARLQQAGGTPSEWGEALEMLKAAGVTPETLQANLKAAQERGQQQQPQAPAVEPSADTFDAFLAENGIHPDDCTPAELVALKSTHRLELADRQRAQQHAEQSFRRDLAEVQTAHPEFKDPGLRDALIGLAELRPDLPLGKVAESVKASIETLFRNRAAAEAADPTLKADQQRPNANRGAGQAPSPAVNPDWVTNGDDETFRKNSRSTIAAILRGGK